MPQGANTDTHKSNGTQPNQNFEKFSQNQEPQPIFEKIPNFENLR